MVPSSNYQAHPAQRRVNVSWGSRTFPRLPRRPSDLATHPWRPESLSGPICRAQACWPGWEERGDHCPHLPWRLPRASSSIPGHSGVLLPHPVPAPRNPPGHVSWPFTCCHFSLLIPQLPLELSAHSGETTVPTCVPIHPCAPSDGCIVGAQHTYERIIAEKYQRPWNQGLISSKL